MNIIGSIWGANLLSGGRRAPERLLLSLYFPSETRGNLFCFPPLASNILIVPASENLTEKIALLFFCSFSSNIVLIVDGKIESSYGFCLAEVGVDVDDRPVQSRVFRGDLEGCRPTGPEMFDHAFDFSPDNALERAGHPDVALERGSIRQDLFVCGRDVGVRAQDGGEPTVEVSAHHLHFACRFGVEVEETHAHVGEPLDDPVDRNERVVPGGCIKTLPRSAAIPILTAGLFPLAGASRIVHPLPAASGDTLAGLTTRWSLDDKTGKKLFCRNAWSPRVTQSTPAFMSALNISGVSPDPPAAFSALQTTKSIA